MKDYVKVKLNLNQLNTIKELLENNSNDSDLKELINHTIEWYNKPRVVYVFKYMSNKENFEKYYFGEGLTEYETIDFTNKYKSDEYQKYFDGDSCIMTKDIDINLIDDLALILWNYEDDYIDDDHIGRLINYERVRDSFTVDDENGDETKIEPAIINLKFKAKDDEIYDLIINYFDC